MKRFALILFILLILSGCASQEAPPTVIPTHGAEATEATEPAPSWVETLGMEWDAAGVLREVPLTVPDGLHYSAAMEFDGDLLLWSIDNHREDAQFVELCLIELDDGSIISQRDVPVTGYLFPKAAGESLYLCDNTGGTIYRLDKSLQTVNQWTVPATEGSFYMSTGGNAYLITVDNHLLHYNLSTGETAPLLPEDPYISWVTESANSLVIKYYDQDNGAPVFAVLDLEGGEYFLAGLDVQADSVSMCGGTWLYESYKDQYVYYLHRGGAEAVRFFPQDATVSLLKEGFILGTSMDGTSLSLYRMDGTLVSGCTVYENGNGYLATEPIWNEALGGYFFVARTYDETSRLLYWDIEKSSGGEDLQFESIPEPDEIQAALESRAAELEKKYGVTILVGNQCDTLFDEFSATQISDYDRVTAALDTLDEALSAYPEGFIRQLRYDTIRGIQIQLISDLQADGSGRTGGGYNAFTQPQFDYYLMVMDIDDSYVETYYHEFSHIIDNYLRSDSWQREDALYSEEKWNELNPRWFDDYTYDYSQMQNLEDDTSFIDGYATISPTEDRARVMEYAMVSWGEWAFAEDTVLYRKLSYYCRCIRDAFDTTGWPDTVLWEQFLK